MRDLKNADAAVVGAPFDTGTTFRVGARFGPEGIRSVSHLLRPYNPSLGVPVFERLSAIDYGDVPVVPGYIEASFWRTLRPESSHLGVDPRRSVSLTAISVDTGYLLRKQASA